MTTDSAEQQPTLNHLRDTLEQPAPLDLRDFARGVSDGIHGYMAGLPWSSRCIQWLEPWLDRPLNRPARLLVALAFSFGMLSLAVARPEVGIWVALLVGLMAGAWSTLAEKARPIWPVRWAARRSSLFRLVGYAAAAVSGVWAWSFLQNAVYLLQGPTPLSLTGALGVPFACLLLVLLLLRVLTPLWDSLEDLCLGSAWRLTAFQLVNLGWLLYAWSRIPSGFYYLPWAEASLAGSNSNSAYLKPLIVPDLVWSLPLLVLSLYAVSRLRRRPFVEAFDGRLSRAALATTQRGLASLGLLAAAGWLAWQQLLPVRLQSPELYQQIMREAREREAEARSLPAAQNGFQRLYEPPAVYDKELGVWQPLYSGSDLKENGSEEEERRFLEFLPVLQRALQAPRFEPVDFREGLHTWQTMSAASDGLSGLTSRLVEKKNYARALDCVILHLQMARRVSSGFWVSRQDWHTAAAVKDTRLWLGQATFSRSDLVRLQRALEAYQPTTDVLVRQIQLDLYTTQLKLADPDKGHYTKLPLNGAFARRFRKSLITELFNRSIAESAEWKSLTYPPPSKPKDWVDVAAFDLNEFSGTDNLRRDHLELRTDFEKLKAMVALELCRRDRGTYPAHLEQLVPGYLKSLPINYCTPRALVRKKLLGYRRLGKSYELSPAPL